MKKKPYSIWYKIALLFFICNLLCMILATMASYIPPYTIWWLALAGLAFPYVLLITLLFALYFLATRHFKTFGFIALIVGATFPVWSHYFAWGHPAKKCQPKKHPFKVMTYNVRNFDLYNWSHNTETRQKMLDLINKERPDILCLQEFFTRDGDTAFDNINAIKNLGFHYYHFNNGLTIRNNEHWGIATFSRYPIEHKNEIIFGGTLKVNGCIIDDIHIRDTTLRVFNMHLQSIYLTDKDYTNIDNARPQYEDSRKQLGQVLDKLKKAFVKRAYQADSVRLDIDKSPHPVIVCGDFNDTPASYTYNTIRHNLIDAFLEAGYSMGKTYTGPVPSFRIDYTFCSPLLTVVSYKIMHKNYSDHYPIVTVLCK